MKKEMIILFLLEFYNRSLRAHFEVRHDIIFAYALKEPVFISYFFEDENSLENNDFKDRKPPKWSWWFHI